MNIQVNQYKIFDSPLESILLKKNKVVINTINAHSYIVAKKDQEFKKALINSDILLPDGEGIVLMVRKLQSKKIKKIAGADLHQFLLEHANKEKLKCFYLGSSKEVLKMIEDRINIEYPKINIKSYSPPFKEVFSKDENNEIINKINAFSPDVLFVGMTAPKQEKWLQKNKENIQFKYAGAIGAVFDFYAQTKTRAPKWLVKLKLEWFYRALTSWRLTKRYLYSNPLFLIELYKLKRKNRD